MLLFTQGDKKCDFFLLSFVIFNFVLFLLIQVPKEMHDKAPVLISYLLSIQFFRLWDEGSLVNKLKITISNLFPSSVSVAVNSLGIVIGKKWIDLFLNYADTMVWKQKNNDLKAADARCFLFSLLLERFFFSHCDNECLHLKPTNPPIVCGRSGNSISSFATSVSDIFWVLHIKGGATTT